MRRRLKYLTLAIALIGCGLPTSEHETPEIKYGVAYPLGTTYDDGFIHLDASYGLNQSNASQNLTASGLTQSSAQAKFPRYYARWVAEGKTISTFMQLNYGVCAANDAFWVGHMHAITGNPAGSGNIQVGPIDDMLVNERIYWPFGRFEGVGTFGDARYNTTMTLDVNGWKGDPLQRNLITSPSYGVDGAMGYHESAQATNLRLYGNCGLYNDPSYSSSGLVCWDLGEASQVGIIKSDFFNDYGVLCERGTPGVFQNISTFGNRLAGMGFVGTALAKVRVGNLSGDDNGALYELKAGHGREAGGSIHFNDTKCESSTTVEGGFGTSHRYTGHPIGILRGQFNIVHDCISYASTWTKSGQLFYVDATLTNGQAQNSRLVITGAKGYGYAALIVDKRGWYYDAPPDFSAWGAEYTTADGVLKVNGVVQTRKPCKVGIEPMGYVVPPQTFNWTAGTPTLQRTGGVTPPPTPITCTGWATGAWSSWTTCENGQQTRSRSVTPSPEGCSTTPPGSKPTEQETQPCTTPPPNPGGSFSVMPSGNIGTNGYDLVPDWTNVKTIGFDNYKATGTTLGGYLAGWDVPGQALRGIKVGSDGSVYDNSTGTNVYLSPAGTVKLNTVTTFTVTLPTPRTIKHLGGWPNTSNGQSFTVTKVIGTQ